MRWPWKRERNLPAHLKTGEWGEEVSARFLKGKGYRIIGRRVRLERDELDIVATHAGVLVFVEVKTRKNEVFGRAVSAVNRGKRASLSRAAVHYLRALREKPDHFRFDVVEVVGERGEKDPEIRHVENAFNLDRKYRLNW